ncbi:MAG TPA: hypothetical protein VMU39_12815 [Solirubrobacteraceae bacterium]|nr:hypothetical protein [Solirubrobacteraceae bacterium]
MSSRTGFRRSVHGRDDRLCTTRRGGRTDRHEALGRARNRTDRTLGPSRRGAGGPTPDRELTDERACEHARQEALELELDLDEDVHGSLRLPF